MLSSAKKIQPMVFTMVNESNVVSILRSLSPFDSVPVEILESVCSTVTQRQFDPDQVILAHSSVAKDLYIVLEGAVDVRTANGVAVSLVPNEAFPVEALQGGGETLAADTDYVARGGVNLLDIPATVIARLRSECPQFDQFCVQRSVIYQQRGANGSDPGGKLSGLDFELAQLAPAHRRAALPLDATIDQVVHELHRTKAREVVLVEDGTPRGIFTRSDLVSRVLVPKIAFDTPAREVMTPALVTLSQRDSGFDAFIEMHRQGVSRVVLLDDNQHFAGVISDSDLLFALQDSSDLHSLITHADQESDFVRAAGKIRELAGALIGQGVESEHLTRLVSTLNDHLVQRIVTVTADHFGIAMDQFCWIALGSEGRHEQTLLTDQDNGLVFACDDPDRLEETRQSMLAFARDVTALLDKCGFPFCTGNIMASNPECCLTESEWRRRFSEWINEPTPIALLNTSIYFDLRPLCGNRSLCDTVVQWMLNSVRNKRTFFHFMTMNALQRQPPIGLFRDFSVDKSDSCIDIKLSGLAILVDGARILGLASGCHASSTVERFRAAREHGLLSPESAANLIAAFSLIQRIRLQQHHNQQQRGAAMTNRINPLSLNNIDRKGFLEALRHANTLQKELSGRYDLERRR